MLLNKNRMSKVMARAEICFDELAFELKVPKQMAMRIACGIVPLEYATAKRLMRLLGYWDFAYVAESGEVRLHAKRIADECGVPA